MSHDYMDCHPGDERFCIFDGSKCTDQGGVMDYNQVSLQLGDPKTCANVIHRWKINELPFRLIHMFFKTWET